MLGTRILRAASWTPILGLVTAAGLLLTGAELAGGNLLGLVMLILGLAVSASAASYVLDDAAQQVTSATPTSRLRRLLWRLAIVLLPGAVAAASVLGVVAEDPFRHWSRAVPVLIGVLAIGVTVAAVVGSNAIASPGDLASLLAFALITGLIVVDPLRRWVSVLPLDQTPHPGRSTALWAVLSLMSAAVTLVCDRDPYRRRRSRKPPRKPSRR